MKKTSFIYFDVGGVVILDFSGNSKWDDMLKSMGVNASNIAKFNRVWNKHRDKITIDFDADWMLDELREIVGLQLPDNFSFLAEFIKRFDPNPSIWPVIDNAKKGNKKVGLLTKMYPRMLSEIHKKANLMPKIDWDVIVDSSVVKMQKPYPEIYELAGKLADVANPSEILFIDNQAENLVIPQKLGWQTFLYNPVKPEEASRRLSELIT